VNVDQRFRAAAISDRVSTIIFWVVAALSALLLLVESPLVNRIVEPILIVAGISGIGAAFLTSVLQTRGNGLLRESQLSTSLGASTGDSIKPDYYNNQLPNSLARLAATTLENTLHTLRVLSRMLRRERTITSVYLILFVLLMAYRWTSLPWLLLLTQTLFSTEVALRWFRMERLNFRTNQVHNRLRQFFQQGGKTRTPNGIAIALAAFTDYECAKDEAALPLDSKVFHKLNRSVSTEWDQMRRKLNIS